MAVSTTNRKAGPFVGNDATTVFPFTFKVFDAEDLLVVLTDAALVENTLVLDTDYTVVLNGDQDDDPGGSVTLVDALETGTLLTITSQVAATQTVVLTSQGGFYPNVINRAFDKLTIIAQQLAEIVGRTIRLPLSSTASGELPNPQPNALIGWNGTGTGFSNVNIADLVTAGAYGTARVETFEGNGAQIDFDLANGPGTIANVLVFIGGVAQVPGVDFSLVSSQRIRFVEAPFDGAPIQVRYATGGVLPASDDLARSDGSNVIAAAFRSAIGAVSSAALALASGAAMMGYIIDADGAVYETAEQIFQERLSLSSFGAVGDGVVDDTAAIQAAFDATINKGIGLFIPRPSVRYVVTSTLTLTRADFTGAFSPGLRLFGCGPKISKFDNRVANAPMIRVESPVFGKFLFGLDFFGFSIETTTNPVNSTGIELRSANNVAIKQVTVKGMSADGLNVTCVLGDADATNMLYMEHLRSEDCGRWGADITSGVGSNEISFVKGQHVFIQNCGTTAATYPPASGGLRAKNQLLKFEMSAFAVNKNVGVHLAGGNGAPNGAVFELCAMENNGGRSVLITGGQGVRFTECQIYCNLAQSPSVATHGFHIDGSTYLIENVLLDRTIVRCTSNSSPMTAFKVEGENAKKNTIRVRNTSWLEYDAAGQVRFDGVQFDPVADECVLTVLSATSLCLRSNPFFGPGGNKTPYRLRYSIGGLSSSGEIVPLQVEGTTGIQVSNSGLAANTLYYIYLYDNSNVPTLELSTTAPEPNFGLGYQVKTGDAARLYKGFVKTNGSSQFPVVDSQYMGALRLGGAQLGTFASLSYTNLERGLILKDGTTPMSSLGDRTYLFRADYDAAKVVDLPSIAAGGTTTFTIDGGSGAVGNPGDDVRVQCDADLGGLMLTVQFTAGNVATVRVFNPTGAAVDLGSTTFRLFINRR